jgi:hypothetical protein
MPDLYRKRLIPDECIHLTGDIILFQSDTMLLTSWSTLHPKTEFTSGISLYLLDSGWKISRFFDADGNFVMWYCDIIRHDYDASHDCYVFTDLLADVIIEPDGFVRVVDLDELSEAFDSGLINSGLLSEVIKKLGALLDCIYSGSFQQYTDIIRQYEPVRP